MTGHTLIVIGSVFMTVILGVIAGHFIQDRIFGNQGSPATVTPGQIAQWEKQAAGHNYFQRQLTQFDITINVLLGGNLGETISSRTSRWVRSKKPEFFLWRWISTWIIWCCDLVQAMHGVKAEAGDVIRALNVLNAELKDLGLPPVELKF